MGFPFSFEFTRSTTYKVFTLELVEWEGLGWLDDEGITPSKSKKISFNHLSCLDWMVYFIDV